MCVYTYTVYVYSILTSPVLCIFSSSCSLCEGARFPHVGLCVPRERPARNWRNSCHTVGHLLYWRLCQSRKFSFLYRWDAWVDCVFFQSLDQCCLRCVIVEVLAQSERVQIKLNAPVFLFALFFLFFWGGFCLARSLPSDNHPPGPNVWFPAGVLLCQIVCWHWIRWHGYVHSVWKTTRQFLSPNPITDASLDLPHHSERFKKKKQGMREVSVPFVTSQTVQILS